MPHEVKGKLTFCDDSATTDWRTSEGSQLAHMLDYFQYQLKGISLLPKLELGAYKQMPYEEINARTYHKMNQSIEPLQFNVIQSTEVLDVLDKCVHRPAQLRNTSLSGRKLVDF
ncbi:hypothetical protein PRIC1_001430 [Phytophthora ramorum]